MKKLIYGVFTFAALAMFTSCSGNDVVEQEEVIVEESFQDFDLDKDASTLEWAGSWVGGKSDGNTHTGTIVISEGSIHVENGVYSGGFAIDMATIANTDLEDDMYKGKLQDHLSNPDFFNVEEFPVTKVAVDGQNFEEASIRIHALGLEFEKTVPVKATVNGDQLVLAGDFDVDFADAEMPGNQLNPEAPENGAVSSVIKFKLNVVLNKR